MEKEYEEMLNNLRADSEKNYSMESLIYLDDPYPENTKASEKDFLVPSLASPPLTNS